ncbi:hypothetical protein [Aeromicrobium sp.]|uniref:hypothetical protein n=1 Tax=Aeromicrobium sp. TaxID=1871063 RepID=UPI0028AD63FB|nr:hypothetical protein [Aeromicrobium sp.]
MNSPADVHEIGLVARRPDGAEVSADDVVAYLGSVRVAAGVVDGQRVGRPGLHCVRMALTHDGLVLRSDDLPATLGWQDLVRSLVHRFGTVALVDDGVVDRHGRHHDHDPPGEVADLLELISETNDHMTSRRSVHVVRTDHDVDSDAQSIANSTRSVVEVAHVDGFTLILDTASTDPGIVADVALRSQLPAVSLRREGDAQMAIIRARQGRRVVTCHVDSGVPVELTPGLPESSVRTQLLGEVSVRFTSRRTFDDATVSRLRAAGTGEASFAHDIAETVGVPGAAAAWLLEGVAPEPVVGVGPLSRREMVARGSRGVAEDVRGEFSREKLTKGPLGGFRRFLLDHPLVTLLYGLTELALAYGLATALEPWLLVRWAVAALVALDGFTSIGIAAVTLRRRARG